MLINVINCLIELLNPCLYEDTDFSKRLDGDVFEEIDKYNSDNYKLPSKLDICK